MALCITMGSCDEQAQAAEKATASLQAQLDSATSEATNLQQASDTLTTQLAAAQAEMDRLNGQVDSMAQQAQHDRQAAATALKEELNSKDKSWKAAMQQATTAALADSSARDEALRKVLRAELEAAAQHERELLKQGSSVAMNQLAAEWQARMASQQAEHAEALSSQAAALEAQHAQQAQQAAVQAEEDLKASTSSLQEAHKAQLAQQAQHAAQQLHSSKQRCRCFPSFASSTSSTTSRVCIVLTQPFCRLTHATFSTEFLACHDSNNLILKP